MTCKCAHVMISFKLICMSRRHRKREEKRQKKSKKVKANKETEARFSPMSCASPICLRTGVALDLPHGNLDTSPTFSPSRTGKEVNRLLLMQKIIQLLRMTTSICSAKKLRLGLIELTVKTQLSKILHFSVE